MNISVWDTYVKRENNNLMHFDILVPEDMQDQQIILGYGQEYLKNKPFTTEELTTRACRFCHIEKADESLIAAISEKGYAILEMENCH